MKNCKNLLLVALFLTTATIFGQKTISGTVIDELGMPLPDASVVEKGTKNGVATDFDGKFTLKTKKSKGMLVISFVGYKSKLVAIKKNLGKIQLQPNSNTLEEVVIVGKGVIDLVKERETPVAVSTIKASEIQEKTGNLEFPELMKATPSVYTTKAGGFGESKISLRGFDNANIAIIINGQPVNDMENGKVYWSNWSGLTDVASGVQIQRGLGASKLAVPSVGGTINVVTKSAEKHEGGFVNFMAGNDNYFKTTIAYNTGLGEDGWSASALFSRMQEDGYIDETRGEGYSYFFALGHKMNEKHSFNLSFMGAAQWHHQRRSKLSVQDFLTYGKKYNADWGYLNGKPYSFRRNYYNKPITSLNWDWKINDKLSLSTVLYASWGRGGGSGTRGKNYSINPYKKSMTQAIGKLKYRDKKTGLILFDEVVANNKANSYTGDNKIFKGKSVGSHGFTEDGVSKNIVIRLGNMNSHDWYGAISNLKYELDEWTFSAGIDLRTYVGYHYNVVGDLLGLDAYYSTADKNLPNGKFVTQTVEASPFADTGLTNNAKINWYNTGNVNWLGTNAVIEYNNHDSFSGVVQLGLSDKSYQRYDYFQYPGNEESVTKNMLGGYAKGGFNFNINENHNIFANAGLIKRQPDFRDVFPNHKNELEKKLKNQTIISYELGYGLKSDILNANVNLYHSTWKDRTLTNTDYRANTMTFMPNVTQVHKGVEVEFNTKPTDRFKIKGAFSYGDWRYKDNVIATTYDDKQQVVGKPKTIYLDNVKVGNSAQLTANLGFVYEIVDDLKFDADWNYVDNLYADFDPKEDKFLEKADNLGALKLPSYNLFDAGVSYKVQFTDKYSLRFRVNVNNVLDTEYISRGLSTTHATKDSKLYKGIDVNNYVFFGFGRTWNASVKFNF